MEHIARISNTLPLVPDATIPGLDTRFTQRIAVRIPMGSVRIMDFAR